MMTETTSEAAKPPPKRPLFKKPTWTRPQNLASPADFFHRSNSASVDPVAEAERKRKAKTAKKEAERARQKAEEKPAEKRRRISNDDDDDLYGISDQDIKSGPSNKLNGSLRPTQPDRESLDGATKSSPKKGPPPSYSSKCYEDKSTITRIEKKVVPPSSNIIDLEDSDEDEDLQATQVKKPPPPEDDDFPASDEEYAELARKAREKARRKRLEDDILVESQKQPASLNRDTVSQRSFSAHAPTPPPPPLDPEVHILVTSRLENSVPLIIKRRLSQRLKDVRVHWCTYNQFTEKMTSSIFLTWRGKRLFDVTSCKGLGIAVDKDGRVKVKEQDDLLAEEDRKIHMEAMTEEIYEEIQRAKRRPTEQPENDVEEEPAPVQQTPPEDQVRLILKAKGFPEFKLIAKPVTTVARMVAGFRKANPAGTESKGVFIVFDGDRLEPETLVSETELSDMDYVDVYVK